MCFIVISNDCVNQTTGMFNAIGLKIAKTPKAIGNAQHDINISFINIQDEDFVN